IEHNAHVSDPMWEKIGPHTKEDGEQQDVLKAMHFEWESNRAQSLKPYYHFRGNVADIDGVLVKGPKDIENEAAQHRIQKNAEVTTPKMPNIKQKGYYDHSSGQRKPLETADTVRGEGASNKSGSIQPVPGGARER
ncbi:hypothetical protein LSAT2_005183, partial [Lamellibrachia satsuma]